MPALRIAEVLARFCARFSLKFYFAGLEPDPRRHRSGQGVQRPAGNQGLCAAAHGSPGSLPVHSIGGVAVRGPGCGSLKQSEGSVYDA